MVKTTRSRARPAGPDDRDGRPGCWGCCWDVQPFADFINETTKHVLIGMSGRTHRGRSGNTHAGEKWFT